MLTFAEADQDYRAAIEAPGRKLADAFASARTAGRVNLKGTDLTQAVLLRLKSFFIAQDEIKRLLQKDYAAPAADFFVETVCFFLNIVFEQLNSSLVVASERPIARRRRALRPDISVWRNNNVIAAIECKTQLGWSRTGWLPDFESREKRLREQHPEAKLFLLVMTGNNWPGFGNDQRVGKQFFVLLKQIWPNQFEISLVEQSITHTIEKLFHEINLHAGG